MSIKLYVGRMGSGKSYEVVSVVILEALRRGRRVVSNIAGLDYQAFVDLLAADGVAPGDVGELVQVEHAQVLEPLFWRTDKDNELGVESFIQPGDLIALDEVWRFWSGFGLRSDDGQKRPDRVMNFFRMHRHFTHPDTGVACDVAIITQDVGDVSRQVRAVVEETYRMEKLTAIGSTKRYRVDVFQGGKISRRPLLQMQRSYESKYFPLYSSHSQKQAGAAAAVEENIDARGNILRGAFFKLVLPASVLLLFLGLWFVYRFFKPVDKVTPPVEVAAQGAPASSASSGSPPADPRRRETGVSDDWRVVGYWSSGDRLIFALDNGERMRVLDDPPAVQVRSMSVTLKLPNDDFATMYSGRSRHVAPSPVDKVTP